MCWEFQLRGYREDLEFLRSVYDENPEITISGSSGTVLKIEDVDGGDEEAKEQAESLMKRIRTAHMSTLHPEHPPVLDGPYHPPEGGTRGVDFQEAPRSGSRGDNTDYELEFDPDLYHDLFVKLPEEDRKAAELIANLDTRYEWVELYWIYERIQSEIGGNPHDRGWVSEDEEGRFCHTAQSREVLGTEARHGNWNPDREPDDPMNQKEAIELVHTIVIRFLEERWGQQSDSN